MTDNTVQKTLTKVPAVTVVFWLIKIAATTLGETAGDAVSMSLKLGYAVSTVIFLAVFLVAVYAQIKARFFHPAIYWVTIVATTTVGTTMADFADRSLGIGYAGGSSVLFVLLLGSLYLWHRTLGSISVASINNTKSEIFYWVTIMFSQTLGTALGDWTSDSMGLGFAGSTALFGGLLAIMALLYYRTKISRTILFWAAFILTRPLGAVVGDLLDKPHAEGGMNLSRFAASAVLLIIMVALITFFPSREAKAAH